MYIQPHEIARLPADVTVLVRSHGYFLYTLEFETSEKRLIYSLDGQKVHRFMNLMDVKEVLVSFPIREAWLVHESAYDEMVGQADGGENQLRVRLPLELPY